MQAHPRDASAASTAAPAEPIALDGKPYYLLGRNGEACDVTVEHSSASRMHAAIVHHSNGRLYVIDLGATHGTFVNGKRLDKHKPEKLTDGARLLIGQAPFAYHISRADGGGDKRKSDSNAVEPDSKRVKDDGREVACSHILVKHKDSRRPSSHKEKVITRTKEEAEQMVLKWRHEISTAPDMAAAFADRARADSHCSSGSRGGDLGTFGRGKMQRPFEEASFALKVGELSDAIFSDSGVHIILRTA